MTLLYNPGVLKHCNGAPFSDWLYVFAIFVKWMLRLRNQYPKVWHFGMTYFLNQRSIKAYLTVSLLISTYIFSFPKHRHFTVLEKNEGPWVFSLMWSPGLLVVYSHLLYFVLL